MKIHFKPMIMTKEQQTYILDNYETMTVPEMAQVTCVFKSQIYKFLKEKGKGAKKPSVINKPDHPWRAKNALLKRIDAPAWN